MPVTLKPEERDALFSQINADFSMLGDFELAIEEGNEEDCYRLGRRLVDGLRLLIDGGLGWRRRTADPTVRTLPDDEIQRIMGRMRLEAMSVIESIRPDREATQKEWDEFPAIRDACESAMRQTRS